MKAQLGCRHLASVLEFGAAHTPCSAADCSEHINRQGIENAFRLGTAIGGSTNLALHIPAIAYEADCGQVTIDVLEEFLSFPEIGHFLACPTRDG